MSASRKNRKERLGPHAQWQAGGLIWYAMGYSPWGSFMTGDLPLLWPQSSPEAPSHGWHRLDQEVRLETSWGPFQPESPCHPSGYHWTASLKCLLLPCILHSVFCSPLFLFTQDWLSILLMYTEIVKKIKCKAKPRLKIYWYYEQIIFKKWNITHSEIISILFGVN